MARVEDLDLIESRRKDIHALFPYAVCQERDRRMVDAFLNIVRVPQVRRFMAERIVTLLYNAGPDFPDRVVTLVSPYARWGQWEGGGVTQWTAAATRWVAAALAVSYTDEIGQSVVDTLLQIASVDYLQPHIPDDIWAWLKKRPSLPPICDGRLVGTARHVVHRVRELGDVELLVSYFLLAWSEWNAIHRDGVAGTSHPIGEDLGGIWMGCHREVLIERLDNVLGQLDKGPEHLKQQNPLLDEDHILGAREQYEYLRGILLEVDREALGILTRMSFRLTNSFNSLKRPQNPTRHSFVPSLSRVRSRVPITLAPRSPNSVLHLYRCPI